MARTKVYCHPDNLEWVKAHFTEQEEKQREPDIGFCHFIRPSWDMFEFIPNSHMEKERIKGYEKLVDRFTDWWDGEGTPPSWLIFFGFVKPIMERVFYQVDDRSVYWRPQFDYGVKLFEPRSFIMASV